MNPSFFLEFIEREKIDFDILDKCLTAVLHLLCIKKYKKTDNLLFKIDTKNSALKIIDRYTNADVFNEFGRVAISAANRSLFELIEIYKRDQNQFMILCNYAINDEFEKYFRYKRIIYPVTKSNDKINIATWLNELYGVDEDDDFDYEIGAYCEACESAPCMCSDPERTSTTWEY